MLQPSSVCYLVPVASPKFPQVLRMQFSRACRAPRYFLPPLRNAGEWDWDWVRMPAFSHRLLHTDLNCHARVFAVLRVLLMPPSDCCFALTAHSSNARTLSASRRTRETEHSLGASGSEPRHGPCSHPRPGDAFTGTITYIQRESGLSGRADREAEPRMPFGYSNFHATASLRLCALSVGENSPGIVP